MEQNKAAALGTESISSLLRKYAIPGIIAMTAISIYNMVDSIYIGHIKDYGSYAISAIAVTFPLMNLSVAFGTLVGIGGATMISILLGQKNYKAANKVLANQISMSVIVSFIFSVLCLLFLEKVLRIFGASELTMPYAKDYMSIILAGTVISNLYFSLNNSIRSCGNPKTAMLLTIFTVILNSILDPIFIFVLDLGVRGAAIATVLCQLVALIYSWYFIKKKKTALEMPKKFLPIDFKIVKDFMSIGAGPFLMNTAASIVTVSINLQLRKYGGDLYIGAFGIVLRISFLFIMVVMGLNQGMQPIAGYNYGARKYQRMKQVYKYTALWATLVMCIGFCLSVFFRDQAISVFTNDPELKSIAVHGLRITNLMFPIIGFQMVTTLFFQCIGMVKKAILLSLSRQLLFLVPLAYILPHFVKIENLWFCFPISDFMSACLTLILISMLLKKLNKLKDGDDPAILGSTI